MREFLHGPERERSRERPEIRLQSEPVVAHIIELVLREESRYGLLEGVSESRPPVPGSPPAVRHGDDLNAIAAHDVYEAEGIAGKHVPSCATSVAGPGLRARKDGVDGLAQLLPEAMSG